MRDQRICATERETMPRRRALRDLGNLPVHLGERHQAAAAARNSGCISSHACRTPRGRYSSGHSSISVLRSRYDDKS